MAFPTDGEINSFTFLWSVENISYCWYRNGERIESPSFVVDAFELEHSQKAKWKLSMYPRSSRINHVSCYLHRTPPCSDPDLIEIDFELAILGADGSSLVSKRKERCVGSEISCWGFDDFVEVEDLFTRRKKEFIPRDTLVVRCRIWRMGKKMAPIERCIARTRIQVEWRSFHWAIEKCTSLKLRKNAVFSIKSTSKENLIDLELCLTGGRCSEELIDINILCKEQKLKFVTFVSYVLDCKGQKAKATPIEYFCGGPGKIGTFTLPLSKRKLIQNKHIYLPNDVLSLHCECAFSTGIMHGEIEGYSCGNSSLENSSLVYNSNIPALLEDTRDVPMSLKDDLTNLYKDGILCDTKLCTETASFPAHTVVLSARSPVFRAMFTSDMKENAKECVHITDIDDCTLRRMLMFLYTDVLEELQWENASQLYAAADKYDVYALKNKCSSILKSSFSPENVCEILILADMHQDVDLKRDAQDYVLENDVAVLHSEEWKLLMDTNSKLAAETMYRNW